MIHGAQLVCSSAPCPSLSLQVQQSHWSLGCSGSHHPKCGCHSHSWWLRVSSFLKFPVRTSNLVINSPQTGTSAQTTLGVSLSYLILAITLWETYYSPLNVTKKLRHSGVPNLKTQWISVNRTWIQIQLGSRGAGMCPWKTDSRACAPPRVLVSF